MPNKKYRVKLSKDERSHLLERLSNALCKYFQSVISSANRSGGSPCSRHSSTAMV